MEFVPKSNGDTIYATKDGVLVYKEPDVTLFYKSVNYKSDNPTFKTDELIGKFTGQIKVIGSTIWYSVDWIHTYRQIAWWQIALTLPVAALLKLKKKTEILQGWVKGDDIATAQKEDVSEAQKAEEDANLETLVKNATAPKTTTPVANKGLFASIFGPTIAEDGTVTNNNIGAIVGVILIFVVGIIGVVFLRKRQAPPQNFAPYPQMPNRGFGSAQSPNRKSSIVNRK